MMMIGFDVSMGAPWQQLSPPLSVLDQWLESGSIRRSPQLGERPLLDLADALARHAEDLPDLFERVRVGVTDAEAQAQDLRLAWCQLAEDVARFGADFFPRDVVEHRRARGALHEIAHLGFTIDAARRVERDRLARDAVEAADLGHRQPQLVGELLDGGLALQR